MKDHQGSIVEEQRFDDHSEPPIEPDFIMVTVRFDIGQAQLSITELLGLSTGQMLHIPDSAIDSIKIRANGALIGTGELVAIGNELGVRLVELRDGKHQHTA